MGLSQEKYHRAKRIIPGGTQLLSKRPEMFLPDLWPAYYEKAKGCYIWDLDGNRYLDMSYMGIGAAILGYADDDVDSAVKAAVDKGGMTTLNAPEEVELAELLIELHPWAEMARYARTGGEAMAIAVRIARAATGKDKVLFCGYHGWHDWYLAANLESEGSLDGHLLPGLSPLGVPRGLAGTSIPFNYNNTDEFLQIIAKHKGSVGTVVMESIRNHYPDQEFIETIRRVTEELGIVLIFDEITAGWRLNLGGAHLNFNVNPDLAVFGKGMSNGYPMAAIIGRKKVMQKAQDTFISSTYWTERLGPVAALATIEKMRKNNVSRRLIEAGEKVKAGWAAAAERNGLKIEVSGIAPLGHFSFNYPNQIAAKTLFTQIMLEKGFLATTAFYASYAHTDGQIAEYLAAVDQAFALIGKALENNSVEKQLKGPLSHTGFKRLT
ncbi:MAG: aminotransferase class III-fold pyridoxal phosphate-dependent enzyme [Candidatus Margulisbacteria bacterium]|nr:aminotransferase class III-fold pyridoxal phosphate-dependent enzyme [Candidatus Margulisiibacteriota bacterium]